MVREGKTLCSTNVLRPHRESVHKLHFPIHIRKRHGILFINTINIKMQKQVGKCAYSTDVLGLTLHRCVEMG